MELGQFFFSFQLLYVHYTDYWRGKTKAVLWCWCYVIRVWKIMCKIYHYLEVHEFLHELDHWVKVVSV